MCKFKVKFKSAVNQLVDQMHRLSLVALCGVVLMPLAQAAPSLEWQFGVGGPVGNGPSLSPQSVTMQVNTNNPAGNTFVPAVPTPITVTVALSNQQYTLTAAESPVLRPMAFGATSTGVPPMTGNALYQSLNGIGTPTNSLFTSTQFDPVGTGMDVAVNGALGIYITTRPLANAGLATNGRYYYGDLTFTFSSPLTNPVFHISGLGGQWSTADIFGNITGTLGFTTELEMDTVATPGVTLSKVSGSANFVVTGNNILNNAALPRAACAGGAGCGSVLASGVGITSIKLRVYLRGDGGIATWQAVPPATTTTMTGDAWYFGGVSAPAPADMSPAFSGLPTAVRPAGVYTGLHLVCTNAGPLQSITASCVPSVPVGSGTISAIVCTPAQPTASLNALSAIDCSFTYTAPGPQGGTDTAMTDVVFTGTTGAANDINGGATTGGNNTTTATVPLIDAIDDGTAALPFATGTSGLASTTASVLGNDKVGTLAATTTNINVSANGVGTFPAGGAALAINADGTINIPANAVPGNYTVPYQICSNPATVPITCDTAVAYVKVSPIVSGNVFNDTNEAVKKPCFRTSPIGLAVLTD